MLLPPHVRGLLAQLVSEPIEACTAPIDRFDLCHRDCSLRERFRIPGAFSVRHPDLLGLLEQGLPAGVSIRSGRCVDLVRTPAGQAGVRTTSGETWEGDLIVAADGVRSACRASLFPTARLTPELVSELVLSLEDAALAERLQQSCRKFHDPAAGLALGLLPCRGGRVILYAQITTRCHPPPEPADCLRFLQQHFGDWNPELQHLLANLDTSRAHLWHTTDLDPLPQLHQGNVVLVGDSGHPLLPFTSQGAVAALEDALQLGKELGGMAADGRRGALLQEALAPALARYSAARLPALGTLLREGRELRRRFLEPSSAEDSCVAPVVGFSAATELRPFADDQVPLVALRRQAFNLRWATQPEDVIPLTAADPDFAVAPVIREAIARHAAGGVFSYGPAAGLPEFREACARFCTDRRGQSGGPERILAVDGAAAGMLQVCRLLLRPGDEAIVFDPVDFLFQTAVETLGGSVVRLPVDPLSGTLALERLEELLSPRTRLLAVCNPLNPVGRVLRRDELERLGEFALRHDLAILNDEVWSDIVFPPARFISLAALSPEVAARCWTVHSFSKNYGLAGLRVGYVHAPDAAGCEALTEASLAGTTMSGVATLSQIAAIAALEQGEGWLADWVSHLRRQRDRAVAELSTMPGCQVRCPEGTYVLFPRIEHRGLSPEALTGRLKEHQRLAVVPGSARWFGPGAEGHLRLVFSTSEAILREGLARLRRGLEELATLE